jgi:outer membrane protein assembly factor BamB
MTPAALLLAAVFSAAPANGDVAPSADWPQWRGQQRDGKSLETGLTHPWPESGPKLLWSVKGLDRVGTGYGSPAVVGDRLYLMGAEAEKDGAQEFCVCLNLADGSQIWKTMLPTARGQFAAGWGRGPRSTPTVDGDQIFVLGTTGDLVCLQKSDGKQVWHKNLVKDFRGQIPSWGYSESVLVDGDKVVCTPGSGTGMLALNRTTGETIWECKEFGDSAGYSSIVPTEVGGVRQYVQQTMESALGVRAADGKLLWKVGEIGRRTAVIPTPVVQDGYAFFTAGYGAGCECYKLEPDGDGTKAVKVYTKFRTLSNHHGGVIAVGDHVYGHSDRGGWTCFAFKQAEDEPVWQSQKLGKGSIAYADGHFYCYSERDGTLARIKVSTSDWEENGRFRIPETSRVRPRSGMVWPHPVIAQGKLFLRDYEYLYCYDLRGN